MSDIPRYTKSKLIFVRSQDRQDPTTLSTDFNVDFGNEFSIEKVRRVVLKSSHIPNTAYNIEEDHVNFSYEYNGIPYNFNIPVGYYNASEISAVIKDNINLQITPALATVSVSTITGYMTISVDTNTIKIISNDLSSDKLGFSVDSADAVSVIGDKLINLQGMTRAFLSSVAVGASNTIVSNKKVNDIFVNIPIQVGFGVANHHQPQDDELASINYADKEGRDLRQMNIQLLNDKFQPINLRGSEVEFFFKIYHD